VFIDPFFFFFFVYVKFLTSILCIVFFFSYVFIFRRKVLFLLSTISTFPSFVFRPSKFSLLCPFLVVSFQFPYNAIGCNRWLDLLGSLFITAEWAALVFSVCKRLHFVDFVMWFALLHCCCRVFPFLLLFLFVFLYTFYQVLWGVSFGVVNCLIQCFVRCIVGCFVFWDPYVARNP
jgi:hypothetical protein